MTEIAPSLRLELLSADIEKSQDLREFLRQSYGIYGIRLVELEAKNDIELRFGDDTLGYKEDDPSQLADFITNHMILTPEQLSCRSDAYLLKEYWKPDGTLDIYQDPRIWIKESPMIRDLIDVQPEIANVIDFLCEQRGLFVKPPHYKLQGTYWNATSNGGLPIVRKKDPIHEGTFMLHDLFHMVVQDPLPFAINGAPGDTTARGNFLSHRMASEAMTMVLADMHAVHRVGLYEKGYDTSKRRIYPIYREILGNKGDIDVYDIVSANIDFCFTGETNSFQQLGASIETIDSFTEKYDTFFSADYDWNDHNFVACNEQVAQNPKMREYYVTARTIFGLPMIDDIYDEVATKDGIIELFVQQLTAAQQYISHGNEVLRMKEVARRFYGGQLAIFYNKNSPALQDESAKNDYVQLSQKLMLADTAQAIREISNELDKIIKTLIDKAAGANELDSQATELYRMHVPLYPAFFINYQLERERIVPLLRKIAQIDHRLA